MFYDKLTALCKEYGEKPTPVLKKLGISPGNLKRWETGAAVNSDTLTKIADYFGVPVDYFFTEDLDVQPSQVEDNNNSIRKIYSVLRAYPDYVASALTGSELSAEELKAVAAYMNCSVEYLLNGADYEPVPSVSVAFESYLTPKDLVMNILSVLAGNRAYRAVQVNISRIIINNLAKLNITREKLSATNLAKKKIADLYSEKSAGDIWGLNNSDLIRISRDFKVGFEFMFTGRN